MNVVIFGASGMIGHGVLLEALDCPEVSTVTSIGRRRVDIEHPKLGQIVHSDFEDFEPLADELAGVDACFWCLGVTSAGLDEATYTRITYDFTMAAAKVLRRRSPEVCFCFVSGAGTDDSERGRVMWARVKGKTENALAGLGVRELVVFRPAFIRARRGARPHGALRVLYPLALLFYPLLRPLGMATSTVEVGRAMLAAAQGLAEQRVLDSRGINQLAARLA
ncbi:epimerase [Haliangium sp.]|uniref:epimerase n=1 Tax=Haliangium sp. TaxID=2663208 RepID=UPI003D09EBFC